MKIHEIIEEIHGSMNNWYNNHIKSNKNSKRSPISFGNDWCYNTDRKGKVKEVLSMKNININAIVDRIFENTDLNSIPVQITSIAKFYGFKVLEMPLESNCSGMIMVNEKPIKGLDTNKAIIVNSNDSNQRKRFTVAHELGHYFLEGEKPCYGHRDVGDYSERERDANNFASELLMPKEKIEKFIKDFKNSIWGDIPQSFLIDAVSNSFNVSKSAAQVRLDKLSLLG